MERKLLKCPVCGGNLNVETDSDSILCRRCGAKLLMDGGRIVKEHDEQKTDDAETAKMNHTNRKTAAFRRYRRIGNTAAAVIFAASFFADKLNLRDSLGGEMKVIAIGLFAIVNLLYYILYEIGQRKS